MEDGGERFGLGRGRGRSDEEPRGNRRRRDDPARSPQVIGRWYRSGRCPMATQTALGVAAIPERTRSRRRRRADEARVIPPSHSTTRISGAVIHASCRIGRVKRKALPLPEVLSTQRRPPWTSDELPGEGEASPVPSARLPSIACLNSTKIVSSSSGAIRAGVGDCDLDLAVVEPGGDVDAALGGSELDRVGHEVEDDLADATPVGADRDGRRLRRQRELDPRGSPVSECIETALREHVR